MAFGDIFNSQQTRYRPNCYRPRPNVVVDTSIDTPAPIDTPTPIVQKFQTEQSFQQKTHLQSKTFKLCKSKGKEFATFDALREKEPIVQEKIVDLGKM
jgi:hypothetical protein